MLQGIIIAAVGEVSAQPVVVGNDWKWVVPVVTLILGFGLKWLQEYLTEKGRGRKSNEIRIEKRRDVHRDRRADSERANLLELQPLLQKLLLSHLRLQSAHLEAGVWGKRMRCDASEQHRASLAVLLPIMSRLHSKDVEAGVAHILTLLATRLDSKAEADAIYEKASALHTQAQHRIGERIRIIEARDLETWT